MLSEELGLQKLLEGREGRLECSTFGWLTSVTSSSKCTSVFWLSQPCFIVTCLLSLTILQIFFFRHRLPEVPLPPVCQIKPISPMLHLCGSKNIYLQLLEW